MDKNELQLPKIKPKTLSHAAPELTWYPYIEEDDRVETVGTGHLHWTIIGFSNIEEGIFKDSCTIEVEADNVDQAISRAMQIYPRAGYRVSAVREACTLDPEVSK